MGERGPIAVPTHLRVVTDTRLAETVAEVTPREMPDKPEVVAADERLSELWDSVVPEFSNAGLLSKVDALQLELTLRHVLVARDAYDVVEAEGVVVKDAAIAGGMKKHPAEQVLRSESEMAQRGLQQMGGSFVSRARTPSVKAGDDGGEANPFASPAVG